MSVLNKLEKVLNKKSVRDAVIMDSGSSETETVWWVAGKTEDDFESGEFPEEGDEWEVALDLYMDDAWNDFESRFLSVAEYNGGDLYVYRMMTVESVPRFLYFLERQKNIRGFKGLGIFWAWDKDRAEAHWAGRGKPILVTGLVKPKDIEYERTLSKNLNPALGPEEAEIEVKSKAPITVVKVEYEGKVIWEADKVIKMSASRTMPVSRSQILLERLAKMTGGTFKAGHCHEFAIGLHRVLGYKIGAIKGVSYDSETGEKRLHLLHAFGVTPTGRYMDVDGRLDVDDLMRTYKTVKNPVTNTVLDKISFNVYKTEKEFVKKLWTIKPSVDNVKRSIRHISGRLYSYIDDRDTKKITPVKFESLVTNDKYKFYGEAQYQYFNKNRLNEKFEIEVEKLFKPIGFWKMSRAYPASGNGVVASFGMGGDPVINQIKIVTYDGEIKDISDEESERNIDEWISKLSKFVATSSKVRASLKIMLGIN